jgi:hypothetical protein
MLALAVLTLVMTQRRWTMGFPARVVTTAIMATSVSVVGVGIGGVAAGATAPPPTYTCTGTLSAPGSVPAGTYQSLIMPAGSICEIPTPGPVTVLSGVVLQKGSGLVTGVADAGSPLKIVGGLMLQPDAAFVAGLKTETSPVNILGRVTVMSGALFYLGTEKPYKAPFASIQGPVNAQDPSAVVIQNTTIGGAVTVSGGGAVNAIVEALSHNAPDTNYTDFEDDQIKGGVSEVGYGGVWGGVIRTVMGGSLIFAYNSQTTIDEYDIGSDIIKGSAYCQGNNPAPNMGVSKGSPSIVHGPTFGDQAATCTGVPTGGTGPPG